MAHPQSILILGGTSEARALAGRLVASGLDVTSSLAGRTSAPVLPEGRVRIGGFGGIEGLAAYLTTGGFSHLVDATHPYAAQISANAVGASAIAKIPMIRLERPAWERPEGADWIAADDMAAAAGALPRGANVLLTIGRQEVSAFFGRTDCRFVARVIDPPDRVPDGWTLVTGRGPFALEDEMSLLERHAITHLVSKNSGGEQGRAKLDAACGSGVQVIMVERPMPPPARTTTTIAGVLDWLAEEGCKCRRSRAARGA